MCCVLRTGKKTSMLYLKKNQHTSSKLNLSMGHELTSLFSLFFFFFQISLLELCVFCSEQNLQCYFFETGRKYAVFNICPLQCMDPFKFHKVLSPFAAVSEVCLPWNEVEMQNKSSEWKNWVDKSDIFVVYITS